MMRFIFLCLLLLALPPAVFADGHYYNVDKMKPAPAPADAETAEDPQPSLGTALPHLDEPPPGGHSVVVTSLGKCYAALGHAEEYEIRRNFVKPYEECERRLALKRKKEQSAKAGDAPKSEGAKATAGKEEGEKESDDDKAADDSGLPRGLPHGFYRVQKAPLTVTKPADDKEKKPQYNQ